MNLSGIILPVFVFYFLFIYLFIFFFFGGGMGRGRWGGRWGGSSRLIERLLPGALACRLSRDAGVGVPRWGTPALAS